MFLVSKFVRNYLCSLPSAAPASSSFRRCLASSFDAHADNDQKKVEFRELNKDRSEPIAAEVSIAYLESEAYRETYGDQPVWFGYRRNFKGQIPPSKTRKVCIRQGTVSTGSPCPLCRDEYLVVDFRNVKLLEQFVSPVTGATLSYQKTNVCQRRHQQLLVAIEKARDCGLLQFDVPFRDYSEYDSRTTAVAE